MEEMFFNDGWMETEPLHTHALNAAAELAADHCDGNPEHIKNTGDFLYHYMSCWYQAILDSDGALVQPAIKTVAWFVGHMIEEHDMHPLAAGPCANMLVRFSALVITKSGGKLI